MHAVAESLFFTFRWRVCSARSRHVSYWAENSKQPEFCINLLFTAPYFRVGPARIKIQRSVQLRSLRPQRKQLYMLARHGSCCSRDEELAAIREFIC